MFHGVFLITIAHLVLHELLRYAWQRMGKLGCDSYIREGRHTFNLDFTLNAFLSLPEMDKTMMCPGNYNVSLFSQWPRKRKLGKITFPRKKTALIFITPPKRNCIRLPYTPQQWNLAPCRGSVGCNDRLETGTELLQGFTFRGSDVAKMSILIFPREPSRLATKYLTGNVDTSLIHSIFYEDHLWVTVVCNKF
jgi:hypothetical protein